MRILFVLMSCLVTACAATNVLHADAELALVLAEVSPEVPDEQDRLRAYSPELYLTGQAGHGVGDDLDLSASCGCAETSSSGSTSSGGPGSGPGVEYKPKGTLRVHVRLIRD